jgi:glycosyltransferase involved in cell wall biosynthesis
MKRTEPYFSVVVPVFHGGQLLANMLRSLERQTHKDFEVVVAPDDGLHYDLSSFGLHLTVLDRKRIASGPAAARNDAVAASRGAIVVMLDADDELPPEYLHTFRQHFRRGTEGIAIAPTEVFSARGSVAVRGPRGGRIDTDEFAWALASLHVVCHRDIHRPWPQGFAEDVQRDAQLIDEARSVRVVDTVYRLRSHAKQTTARIRDERHVRRQYAATRASTSEGVAHVFAVREAANLLFDRFREPRERWYEFFERAESRLGSCWKTPPDTEDSAGRTMRTWGGGRRSRSRSETEGYGEGR